MLDASVDLSEGEVGLHEHADGVFVCGVEGGAGVGAGIDGVHGEGDRGESARVNFDEIERGELGDVESRRASLGSVCVAERVLDRGAHVWGAHLGDDGGVGALDHGVDDGLWVDDRVEL